MTKVQQKQVKEGKLKTKIEKKTTKTKWKIEKNI